MKTSNFQKPRLAITVLTMFALMAANGYAQDLKTTAVTDTQPQVVHPLAPPLSYGVPEVLQLSQAKVGDSTIINYIHNSGNNYGLNAAQIIYLRQEGVSDAVINAMLNQRSLAATSASNTATSPTTGSTAYSTPASAVVVQPAVSYVQSAPSSSVYIIPDTQTYYYNSWLYYHSPYYCYYPAYSYCWPRSTVSVSFIGGRGWVGYRGGWHVDRDDFHGGWYGGGGWHRTGGWHR